MTVTTDRATPDFYIVNDETAVPSSTLDRYAFKSEGTGSSQQIKTDSFNEDYLEYGLIEPSFNPQQLTMLTEVNSFHAICVKTKAGDIGGLGWSIQAVEEDKGESKNKNRLDDFFKNCCEKDLIFEDVLKKYCRDFEELGYSCLEVIRYNYNPQAEIKLIEHIPSHTIRIHKDENKYCQIRGNNKRWFKRINYPYDIDKDTGDEHPLKSLNPKQRATELIFDKNYSPSNDFYGLPDAATCLGAILGDLGRENFNIKFFENYGVPSYAVTILGGFDPGVKDKDTGKTPLQSAIEKKFKSFKHNPHSVLITTVPTMRTGDNVEVKFEKLSVDVKEASFRLYRLENRDEIITAHGMDPYRIGVMQTGSMGGNTSANSRKNYKSSVIIPRQRTIAATINKFIVADENGFNIQDYRFHLNEFDTTDRTQEVTDNEKMINNAIISPNQARVKLGLEPSDNPLMDEYYMHGTPLVKTGTDEDIVDNVVANLETLKENILEEAEKNDLESEDNTAYRQIYNVFKRFYPF